MRNFVIAAAAAVLATGCATGHIQDHSGFHFHAELGAGNNDTDVTYAGETGKVSGGGGSFSIAAGGALAPNLILGGEVWGVGASEPDVREFGGSRGTLVDVTYSAYGVGPRVTWYVMPANVYFSLTPSFTQLAFSDDYSDYSEESRWGLGLRAAVGKEWFVSHMWGIGISGALHLSANKWPDDAAKWKTFGGSVLFSASFN